MQHNRNKACILTCLAAGACLFGGCATTASTHGITHSATFGDAVRQNITAQTVAPTDLQKNNTVIPVDPDKRALALKNYKENTVPEPSAVATSSK
jgi:type IV pilus biogenesis protein CpaD/CtpE